MSSVFSQRVIYMYTYIKKRQKGYIPMTQVWLSPEGGVTYVSIFFLVLFCSFLFFIRKNYYFYCYLKKGIFPQYIKIRYLPQAETIKSLKGGIMF